MSVSKDKEELHGFKVKDKVKKSTQNSDERPFIHWNEPKPSPNQFKDYTFVIATISVANIGQMTVDLIRENLGSNALVVRRGYFVCPKSLVPVVGEFGKETERENEGSNNLVSSCELFVSESEKLVILQHHGIIAQGRKGKFVNYLMNFIGCMKFRKVLVLSSSFASQRTDRDLDFGPGCVHYVKSNRRNGEFDWDVSNKGWKECEAIGVAEGESDKGTPQYDLSKFRGSGIAPLLFQECLKDQIENLTLFIYTSDGDNRQEAGSLFIQANRVLKIIPEKELDFSTLIMPQVWNLKSNPPQGIY